MLTPDLYQMRAVTLAFQLVREDLSAIVYQDTQHGLSVRQSLARLAKKARAIQQGIRTRAERYPLRQCGYCGAEYRHTPRVKPICNACCGENL